MYGVYTATESSYYHIIMSGGATCFADHDKLVFRDQNMFQRCQIVVSCMK